MSGERQSKCSSLGESNCSCPNQFVSVDHLCNVVRPRRESLIRIRIGGSQTGSVEGEQSQFQIGEIFDAKRKRATHRCARAKQDWATVRGSPFVPPELASITQIHRALPPGFMHEHESLVHWNIAGASVSFI